MKAWIFAAAAAFSIFAGPEAASAQGLVIDAAGARAEERWGVEGSVGYRIGTLGFAITPSVGAFVTRSDEQRYVEHPDPSGGTQCIDTRDGDSVRDIRCENADVRPFARVEATYSVPLIAEIGLGVRIGKDTQPYGTVAFPVFPAVKLKGNAGPDYVALGLRVGL